ncbi:MAG: fatty acid desaturase [Polyangiales bacterium]
MSGSKNTGSKNTESQVWKANSGMLALPTVLLSAFALLGHIAVAIAHAKGWLGALPTITLATLFAYIAFTPLHEASHGNIAGRSGARRLETLVGWISGLQLAAPMPAFKVLHLRHHGQTNHATNDPDMWVVATGRSSAVRALTLTLRCFTLLPHYYLHFFIGAASKTRGAREQRRVVIGAVVVLAFAVGVLAFAGFGLTLLFAWVVPAIFATAILGLLFDWLPHRPHTSRERYKDTRAIDAPLGIPMLGQHLHLIHHLYPRVPFYRYRVVFDALRPTLVEKGAPISVPFGGGELAVNHTAPEL